MSLSEIAKIPFLGTLPIDPRVSKIPHQSVLVTQPDSPVADVFRSVVKTVTFHERNAT